MAKMVKCKTCGADIAKTAKICPNCGAKIMRHKGLGTALVILGVFLLLGAIGAFGGTQDGGEGGTQSKAPAVQTDQAVSEEPKNKPTISMEEFEAISSGMTYDEVVEIIGSEGELMSESDIGAGSAYKTSLYTWRGEGQLGANANVTFQGGKVIAKAQFGLR